MTNHQLVPTKADVIVIGGGIVGCAIAHYLTQRGADVLLLERHGIGSGATGRSGGGVRQSARVSDEIPLALESVALFPALSDELGIDIEYSRAGNLRLVEMYDHMRPMQVDIARQQSCGLDVRWLEATEALEIAPALRWNSIVGASYCPTDGHCNPFRLVTGFFRKAQQGGARVLLNSTVQSVQQCDDGQAVVETATHRIRAQTVVVAAGFGSQELCLQMGFDFPLLNVRYESMITEPLPPTLAQMFGVASSDLFFRQTRHGGIHFGGGVIEEEEGEDTRTTEDNLQLAVSHVARLVTDLEKSNLLRTWGGQDPSTPDGMPVIDYLNENVFLATGFCGHGLALGPMVGRHVAQWIATGARPEALTPFRRDRFEGLLQMQTKWTPGGAAAPILTGESRESGAAAIGAGIPFMIPPKYDDADGDAGARLLSINPAMCTGCRMCETACSIENFDIVRHAELPIRVAYPSDDFFLPIMCIHCDDVDCMQACSFDALEFDERGIVKVIEENCTSCMLCIPACPTGGITYADSRATVMKCDLCGGDPSTGSGQGPACARYCPTEAITFRPLDDAARESMAAAIKENLWARVEE